MTGEISEIIAYEILHPLRNVLVIHFGEVETRRIISGFFRELEIFIDISEIFIHE